MKSFTEFLESHNIHLNEIDSIIRQKDNKIRELVELTQENCECSHPLKRVGF